MKKLLAMALSVSLFGAYAAIPVHAETKATETVSYTYDAGRWDTHTREMEKLDRGLIAVNTDGGVYLSWRLLDSEDNRFGSAENNVSFDIYRDGEIIASESETTNYLDTEGTADSTYCVVPEGENPYTTARIVPQSGEITGRITGNIADRFAKVYAVKYDTNGVLSNLAQYEPESTGQFRFEAGFKPDRVFVWKDLTPVSNESSGAVSVMENNYFDIPLEKPADETIIQPDGTVQATYSFFPADCSAGDLDGDGEYEIVVKWTSSERDVGSPGDPSYSGTVRFAAYKLNGKKLWQRDINLGRNVYSSAHTVQFLVYDFDLDGKAELITQTSLGSTDAAGKYVSHAADPAGNADIYNLTDKENAEADYRGGGRIVTGEEFLTVFDGETGRAVDTINLPTTRGDGKGIEYGDDFGNRSNRFMASVAYLDGERPYAVYSRGYYFAKEARDKLNDNQRTSIAGISFDGKRLNTKYRFDTNIKYPGSFDGSQKYAGNGNHNCTVADVNGDGKDEYIIGALCVGVDNNDELRPRWCTFMEHGDALHIGDYDPTHTGFEFFTVHEDSGPNYYTNTEINYGMSVIDADTGSVIRHWTASKDTGRGIMANVGAGGYYQVKAHADDGGGDIGPYKKTENGFETVSTSMSLNFRIFWDGDLYDELLDGTSITSWNGSNMAQIFNSADYGCVKINGTKSNPALQADLFGDWREEVVYPTEDGNYLRVFTTTTPTDYKLKTLMHDPVYRSGVAAEQTAYNQPPHVGMYLADEMFKDTAVSISIDSPPSRTVYGIGEEFDRTGMVLRASRPDGTSDIVDTYKISGFDSSQSGQQTITVTYQGQTATFDVTVKSITGITATPLRTAFAVNQEFDTSDVAVEVSYEDGTSEILTSGYTVSGYNSQNTGSKTVTVSYAGFTDSFTVTVKEADISLLDGTYYTASTDSVLKEITIGSYKNNFTISHKLTINSLPADGEDNKNSTKGFFVRFTPASGTGAGWYFVADGENAANVYWKSGSDGANICNQTLKAGETYTVTYKFTNVAVQGSASAAMTITASDGTVICSRSNLSLRNMSENNRNGRQPLTKIQIYNQAKSGHPSSITISNATLTQN